MENFPAVPLIPMHLTGYNQDDCKNKANNHSVTHGLIWNDFEIFGHDIANFISDYSTERYNH